MHKEQRLPFYQQTTNAKSYDIYPATFADTTLESGKTVLVYCVSGNADRHEVILNSINYISMLPSPLKDQARYRRKECHLPPQKFMEMFLEVSYDALTESIGTENYKRFEQNRAVDTGLMTFSRQN